MKTSPLLLLLIALSNVQYLSAQTDSLYTQQWNRDPVTSLNHTASAQRQIITAEQIRASGYARLSDVLQLIDGWTYTTLMGDKWSLQSNGAGNYKNQSWILMINGQRITFDQYNTTDLNLLGIAIPEIERIEIMNASGMYLGEFATNGLIHIVTKKTTKEGIRVSGFFSNRFNLIDPKRSINNVNLFNNRRNLWATVGYTKNTFNINGSVGYLTNYDYDTINNYSYALNSTEGYSPKILSSRIETQYTHNRITHQIQSSFTEKKDFLAYVPSTRNYINCGYVGLWNLNAAHQFKWQFSSMLGNGNTASVHSFVQHRFLKSYKAGNFSWQNGVGFDYRDVPSFNKRIRLFSSINIPINRKINLFGDVQFAFGSNQPTGKLSAGIYKRISFISNYSIVLSQSTNENISRYYFPFELGVVHTTPYTFTGNIYKQSSADFYYNLNFGNSVKFSYNAGIKLANDIPFDEYPGVDIRPSFVFYQRTTNLNAHQFNWINRFNFHYDIVKNLVFDINYMRTSVLESSNSNLLQIPKHKFTFILQYEFPKWFTVWTRNYWQSETKWWNEAALFNYSFLGNSYYTLPAIYTWDIGISKKLYKDHLNLNISARNLFNSTERYYPVGAQFDTRFTASISTNIDGLFASRATKP